MHAYKNEQENQDFGTWEVSLYAYKNTLEDTKNQDYRNWEVYIHPRISWRRIYSEIFFTSTD